MRVADVLRNKGVEVATVAPTDTVGDAVAMLGEKNIGAIVVTADGSRIDGIVSERDVVRALVDGSPAELLDRPVGEIMTSDVFTCTTTDRIEQLMSMMTENRIRHVPVDEGDGLAGIVSIGDVVKWRLSELEDDTRVMEEYIQHGR